MAAGGTKMLLFSNLSDRCAQLGQLIRCLTMQALVHSHPKLVCDSIFHSLCCGHVKVPVIFSGVARLWTITVVATAMNDFFASTIDDTRGILWRPTVLRCIDMMLRRHWRNVKRWVILTRPHSTVCITTSTRPATLSTLGTCPTRPLR